MSTPPELHLSDWRASPEPDGIRDEPSLQSNWGPTPDQLDQLGASAAADLGRAGPG